MPNALERAVVGPAFSAELVSLRTKTVLNVGYNWLYSALYCPQSGGDGFRWVVSKIDDGHVSLSPQASFQGMTLYASARDDNDWFMQVQAPYSADWITAVGRDETLAMVSHDLLLVSFNGFNGQAVTVNDGLSDHDGMCGYRLQSLNGGAPQSQLWALRNPQSLQAGIALPSALSDEAISDSLAANGLPADSGAVDDLRQLISAKL